MKNLLKKIRENNILLEVVDGKLRILSRGSHPDQSLITEIKESKTELIRFLTSNDQVNFTDSFKVNIPAIPHAESYPLSPSQRRLWVLSQFEGGNIAYNTMNAYVFEGNLSFEAVEHSFSALIDRHEILRTVFKEDAQGEVRQFVCESRDSNFRVKYKNFRNEKAQEEKLRQTVQKEFSSPFDLANGPLLRVLLCQVEDRKWIFSYAMHHIISDGWSMGILINEFLLGYNLYSKGGINPLPPLRIQYKDYAAWQHKQLSGESLINHKNYWLKQFEGELPVLQLPGDKPRPAIKTYNGATLAFWMAPEFNNGIKSLSQEAGATFFMGILSVLVTLLHRYTGQEDIIVGTPIAGREHVDLEGQIGLYLNTLALRTRFKGEDSYVQLVNNIKQVTLGAYEHQGYPFDELVDELHLQRDMSRNALFDVLVILQNIGNHDPKKEEDLDQLKIKGYEEGQNPSSKFDLTFNFCEIDEHLQMIIEYNRDIYTKRTIEQLGRHFDQLTRKIIAQPLMPVNKLDYLYEDERQRLLFELNDTAIDYPRDKTIVDLFETQVKLQPADIALVAGAEEFSYEELHEISNQLGNYLRTKYKIEPNDLVGIKLDRSAWMMIGILGVLKSGAAYVPIDPAYPQDRIDYILEDSQCKLLLDEDEWNQFRSEEKSYSRTDLQSVSKPGDLAYVIYTSGSTGKPKGVMIEHRNVVSFLENFSKRFFLEPGIVLGATTNYTFDISVLELAGALACGIKIVLIKDTDPLTILQEINAAGITALQVTPSRLNQLMEITPDSISKLGLLKVLLVGGEALSHHNYERLKELTTTRVINVYGPTETTIWSSSLDLGTSTGLSIGKPLLNETIYITDKQHNLCPSGIVGEICISGEGLARGYLNKPGLTAQKFVPNPFKEGQRMYKTGDLGRWLPDGNIEFIGRKDDQVKIRGHRIELGEIESALQNYPGIDSSVVIVRTDAHGEKDIVAYLVTRMTLDIGDVRSYIRKILPAHMLPGYFVQLDELPLTFSGKVDRKRLPDPRGYDFKTSVEYVAPRNEIEDKLVAMWQEILGKEQVGIKDNFFDLGGHSLKATRLVSKIYKELEAKVGLAELFTAVTPEEQAQLILRTHKISYAAISPAPHQPHYPLSFSQHRLWILSQFEESNIGYNVPGAYVFDGELNREAYEHSFNTLIERHETLRTVFREDEKGEIRQFIQSPDETGFQIEYYDLRNDDQWEEKLKRFVQKGFSTPFNHRTGPLLRAGFYQVEDKKWVFTYVVHHIISDGWSMGILIRELLQLYNAYITGAANPLTPLRIQYKDYAVWQRTQLGAEVIQPHKDYWLKQFEGELPVLDLPSEKIRPAIKTYNGESINKLISAEYSEGIKSLSRDAGCTLFMGMLAAVNTLFYRYTGQTDIIIGTPVAGREHIDLEEQIGFYANTLAIRTQFRGESSYRELLDYTRQLALGAYDHQLYPFDKLVNELNLHRDISRNPLFDIQVIVQNAETGDKTVKQENAENLVISGYEEGENTASAFDMVLNFIDTEEGLHARIVYNKDVYDKRSVTQLADHLDQMLGAIIAEPGKPISELEFLNEKDREQLLIGFNDTSVAYPKDRTLVNLFEEQVARTPDNIAVVSGNQKLTYSELNERSNQVANYLRSTYNIRCGELVGIMLDRTEMMIIAILGVLKCGGAYVPIDPEYPKARKAFIIKDTGIRTLIIQAAWIFDLEYYHGNVFAIDVQLNALDTPVESSGVTIHPEDLAYVIYTSGSTGEPKGVMIEHAAVANSIQSLRVIFDMKEGERSLQFSSSSFDVSVFEIFIVLVSGASLYIISEEEKKTPLLMEQYIIKNNIDIASIPPAYLKLLQVEAMHPLKRLITGGESVTPANAVSFAACGIYYNAYGPTESSIGVAVFKTRRGEQVRVKNVPIGTPIPNTQLYVVDEYVNLVPVGVTGEIYIGGAGLARGYLNNPDLTATKFVSNPFKQGEKLYKTGDMGRWLPDGNMEFVGRKDDQVKIRGYRIESGEVENALQEHPAIDAAAVVVKPNKNGEKELIAYIVSPETIDTAEIISHMTKILPAYMLPHQIIQLEKLPLTTNGKVDKKKLPDPEGSISTSAEYVAPRTDAENKMVKIWEEILGKEGIGIRNNFFDSGGDSIKILRMTAELRKKMNFDIPVTDIYKYNTIENILAHIVVDKEEIDSRNRKFKESEIIVKEEIAGLKYRILSLDIPGKENIDDIYPMSDIEKGMVYESLVNEKLGIYHDQMVMGKVFIDFEINLFRLAVELLVDKHPILRTSFNLTDYETEIQVVHKKINIPVSYTDISNLSGKEQEEEVRAFMKAELDNPFRFGVAPQWRMSVFNFGNDQIVFVFQTHHSIIDGWSDASFTTELHNLYLKLKDDSSFKPEKLKASYKDFIIRSEIDKRQDPIRDFWKQELAGFSRIDLFADVKLMDKHSRILDDSDLIKLEKTAVEFNTTIKTISLCAYLYTLKLLSGESEIVTGVVTNNRPDCEDGDKILGCFLNTIPLRIMIDSNENCRDFVVRVHEKLISLKNYEGLSIFQISQLHTERLDSGNPFFDTLFNYADFHAYHALSNDAPANTKQESLPSVNIDNYGRTNTYFDVSINLTGGRYSMGLKIGRKLKSGFSPQQVGKLYFDILTFIINSPARKMNELELLNEAEKNQLLQIFNNNGRLYPKNKTVLELFEEQVERAPANQAIVAGGKTLTYSELNEKANQFTHYLRKRYNIQPGDLAGIKLERTEWLIVAILGILKSGAAYVPIDPEYPQERISYMIADSRCKMLVDEKELEKFIKEQVEYSIQNPVLAKKSSDLAYVIYTSGSTGQPKGVMVEYRTLANLCFWHINNFSVTEKDRATLYAGIAFDASVWELFPYIITGACLYIVPRDIRLNVYDLNAYYEENNISISFLPTQVGEQFLKAENQSLRYLLVGGDKLNSFIPQKYEVVNNYGPTENTVVATSCTVHRYSSNIPIGKPIFNTQVYIINEAQQLLPTGLVGEICIAGESLARGYLNNPELTAEKFILNPFREGERMYKTGDMGRWLPDGSIEFTGRKDNQVKIRGYRVELGEIETVLLRHEYIDSAIVIARHIESGENELVAYVVSRKTADPQEVRLFLGKTLPPYMVPYRIIQIEELPLNANGKIDRGKLPDPGNFIDDTVSEYIPPRNDIEEKLVRIWQEILDKEKIGVTDNFFELGGHSIKAMKLSAKVHKEFNFKIRLEDMFNRATIEELAKDILREAWLKKSKAGNEKELVTENSFVL